MKFNMMNYFCFELHNDVESDDIWELLTLDGYQILYGEEEPGQPKKLYGYFPIGVKTPHPSIVAVNEVYFDQIDWQAQWKEAGGDDDGIVKIDLSHFVKNCTKQLKLFPGAGFGDFSHPTTRLTLELMGPLLKGRFLLDVGCGSGVLALAGLKAGAIAAHGIDISEPALQHAESNALRNNLKDQITFGFPENKFQFPKSAKWLIVMNMISSEQEQAWKSISPLIKENFDIITSGILIDQRKDYLDACKLKGWELRNELQKERWMAFHFTKRVF
jgi:ribosomal protein L11 methyltransferase